MTSRSHDKIGAIGQLEEFIKKAEKLGKYPNNTAAGMLSALKLVADGLTDEEPEDINYIKEQLEEIFQRQYNRLNLSPASLQTYITRVRRIISDFKAYGIDTKAFQAWKAKIARRPIKTRDVSFQSGQSGPTEDSSGISSSGSFQPQLTDNPQNISLRTVKWSLRPNLVIQIQLPIDLNQNDVSRLKKLLDLEAELTPSKEGL